MLTDGLVEFWTLNDTRVGAIGSTLLAPADAIERYIAGKIGKGWEPALLQDRVLRGSSPLTNPGNTSWSASFWVSVDPSEEDALRRVFMLRDGATTRISASVQTSPYSDEPFYSECSLSFGGGQAVAAFWVAAGLLGWNHIALSVSPGSPTNVSVWLNGQKWSGTTTRVCVLATTPVLWVGGWSTYGASSPPVQAIDAFGWWNRPVSDADIDELYNAGAGWEPVIGGVITNILWGSTPDRSRILNSRIVRGMV